MLSGACKINNIPAGGVGWGKSIIDTYILKESIAVDFSRQYLASNPYSHMTFTRALSWLCVLSGINNKTVHPLCKLTEYDMVCILQIFTLKAGAVCNSVDPTLDEGLFSVSISQDELFLEWLNKRDCLRVNLSFSFLIFFFSFKFFLSTN